jgi:hypothetical protein
MECTNLVDPHQLLCPWFTVVFVLFCIYTPRQSVPKTDCQPRRRSILDSLGLQRVFGRTNLAYRMHLFGGLFQTYGRYKNNRWTNINPFHNGTIFDKPREKTRLAIKRHSIATYANHMKNVISNSLFDWFITK